MIDLILVPQGAEYQAVCRGLKAVASLHPVVLPIPISPQPVTRYLRNLKQTEPLLNSSQTKVIVMGLCGSLSLKYEVGDIVLYKNCWFNTHQKRCDVPLTDFLRQKLDSQDNLVTALTSDRILCSQKQKSQWSQKSQTQVVDMEGFAVLDVLQDTGMAVSMLRVVSDGCEDNLPDLNHAISIEGVLEPFPLAMGLMSQPISALNLIRHSLQSLKCLQQVTTELFAP